MVVVHKPLMNADVLRLLFGGHLWYDLIVWLLIWGVWSSVSRTSDPHTSTCLREFVFLVVFPLDEFLGLRRPMICLINLFDIWNPAFKQKCYIFWRVWNGLDLPMFQIPIVLSILSLVFLDIQDIVDSWAYAQDIWSRSANRINRIHRSNRLRRSNRSRRMPKDEKGGFQRLWFLRNGQNVEPYPIWDHFCWFNYGFCCLNPHFWKVSTVDHIVFTEFGVLWEIFGEECE